MEKDSIIIQKFNELSNTDLYDILKLRSEIFVIEQKCIYQDLDDIDKDSIHVYLKKDNKIISYLRVFIKDDKTAQIGRVVTAFDSRRKGYSSLLMEKAIDISKNILKKENIYLEAQSYAIGLYKKHGFEIISKEFMLDGIPHVEMERKL